jgi:hypothetical protein
MCGNIPIDNEIYVVTSSVQFLVLDFSDVLIEVGCVCDMDECMHIFMRVLCCAKICSFCCPYLFYVVWFKP